MYYLSPGKVWKILDAALKMSAKQADRGGRTIPPPPPAAFFSPNARSFSDGSVVGKSCLRLVLGTAFPFPPSFYAFFNI